MRRFDKKHNMAKVNLLAEQRYLESKGLITEGKYFADVLDKGTKIKFDGKDAVIVAHLFNPGEEAIYTIKYDNSGTEEQVIANDKRIEKINESFGISENYVLNSSISEGVQKTDSDIDELANEIIKRAKGDIKVENDLIIKTAAGDKYIQSRLTNRVSKLKNK